MFHLNNYECIEMVVSVILLTILYVFYTILLDNDINFINIMAVIMLYIIWYSLTHLMSNLLNRR